ncbi:MAG: DUF5060 domain-containing protein, partial [Pseudanabaenales cyanobacterium]|nr:DUF5060 domain-containing protein [Pseudanabaenales cyanobacterium]
MRIGNECPKHCPAVSPVKHVARQFVVSMVLCCATLATTTRVAAGTISVGEANASLRGVHELRFKAGAETANPFFDRKLTVVFKRPDGSKARVGGFFDGEAVHRARAYCDQPGEWSWRTESNDPGMNDREGAFVVEPSDLPGKLRLHPEDPRQFARDNGEWFLHLGDAAFRYTARFEPRWREY